jgi:hypothetical protein
MKNGMLPRVALVRTDVSEEYISSIIRVIIGDLGILATALLGRPLRLNCILAISTERVVFVSVNSGSLLSAP